MAVTFAHSAGLSDLSGLRLLASESIPTATSVIDAYRAISSGFSNTEGPVPARTRAYDRDCTLRLRNPATASLAMAEVGQPVEDRGRLARRFDLEPDSFGAEFEAELEEAAASLLTPSKVCHHEQGILAVFESQASRPCTPGDLDDPKVHELSPLVDPSAGATSGKRTGNRYTSHVDRL